MRSHVHSLDLLSPEILLVDLDLVIELDVVGHVDLDGAVTERLHHFIALKLLVFRLIGVAEDHFVDIGLGELLGLDQVFLAGAEQVVEECDVQLEHFDEFDDAAVGDVQLAVEVEGAGVGVGAILGDLAIIDVAGQFRAVLVLFVLGLEGADATAVLLGEDEPLDLDVLDDFLPLAVVHVHQIGEDFAAEGADLAVEANLSAVGQLLIDGFQDLLAGLARYEQQRLFVHGAFEIMLSLITIGQARQTPGIGVALSDVGAAVILKTLLEQSGDGRFAGSDGTMQQEDALLGAVALRGRLEEVHQLHQRAFQPEDGVRAFFERVGKEVVPGVLLLELGVRLGTVGEDHVINALESVARDIGCLGDNVQVLRERAFPVLLAKTGHIQLAIDDAEQRV